MTKLNDTYTNNYSRAETSARRAGFRTYDRRPQGRMAISDLQ